MGKGEKYLLITLSFPHCPQLCPQGLSTIHSGCGYSQLGWETICDSLRQKRHFFADRKFYQSVNFVQNLGLDSCSCPGKSLRRNCPGNRIRDRAKWAAEKKNLEESWGKPKILRIIPGFLKDKSFVSISSGEAGSPGGKPKQKKISKRG